MKCNYCQKEVNYLKKCEYCGKSNLSNFCLKCLNFHYKTFHCKILEKEKLIKNKNSHFSSTKIAKNIENYNKEGK